MMLATRPLEVPLSRSEILLRWFRHVDQPRHDVHVHPDGLAEWEPHRTRAQGDFVVRLGIAEDVSACVDLVAAIGLDDPAAWRETLTKTVRDGVARALFVAEANGEIVGYSRAVHARAPAEPEGWYLLGVTVAPQWRRKGIGEELTRRRMQWVAERADTVYYFTHPDNLASQALHERLGFVEVHASFVPPGGTPEFAATQRLYLAQLNA
jgi:ribosomal protein S18 acetylase RimI-like enzyme